MKLAAKIVLKNRIDSILHVFGLVVGFTSCILIFMFVVNELGFDRFHEKSGRTYRAVYKIQSESGISYMGTTSPPLGPALAEDFPEVEHTARLRYARTCIVKYNDKQFYEDKIFYADSTLFDIFTFPFEAGDPQTALNEKNSVVITKETADKYFGSLNPLGEAIKIKDLNLKVTGVLKPIPQRSHWKFDFLISFRTFKVPEGFIVTLDSWNWRAFYTYILLEKHANPKEVESKISELLDRHNNKSTPSKASAYLQPLPNVYFETEVADFYGMMAYGSRSESCILLAIAAIILFFTGFNYFNLTLAHTIRRVPLSYNKNKQNRKRNTLKNQFFYEPVLKALISLLFAVILVLIFQVISINLFFKTNNLSIEGYLVVWLPFILITLIIGLITGRHSSAVAFNMNSAKELRAGYEFSPLEMFFKKIITLIQLIVVITLISAGFITSKQMKYVRNKDLGFDKDKIIVLDIPGSFLKENFESIKEKLLQTPGVSKVSASGDWLDGRYGSHPVVPEEAKHDESRQVRMAVASAYPGYFETLGIKIIDGRDFSSDDKPDRSTYIINETGANMLSVDNPVGKKVQMIPYEEWGEIIGVTEDFHFASLHEEIKPIIFNIPVSVLSGGLFIRVNKKEDIKSILQSLERSWGQIAPEYPFSYGLLNESIDKLYTSDQEFSELVAKFSILTLIIALLGLYGLASCLSVQPADETGSHKLFGLSVSKRIYKFSIQFIILAAISSILACGIAYFSIGKWLENFAYHIEMNLGIFIIIGILSIGFVALAVALMASRKELTV